jgi:uncharacterized protein DUF3883
MSYANYNTEFAFKKNIFTELVTLAAKGLYNFEELRRLGYKHSQLNMLGIGNTINLLVDSDVIHIKDGKCHAELHTEIALNELIFNNLNKDKIFEAIQSEIEEDENQKQYLDPINFLDSYSGVLALIEHLGFVKYDSSRRIFYLTHAGYRVCSKRKKSQLELEKDLAAKKEMGTQGERYILDREQVRLNAHPKFEEIKRVSDDDVGAGYDIESFKSISSPTIDNFIEVKTFKDTYEFHWSINEVKTAEKLGERYKIVLVNFNKINDDNYQPKEIINPYKFFEMKNVIKKILIPSNSSFIQPESFLINFKENYSND